MKRPPTPAPQPAAQLDLLASTELRQLRAENAWLRQRLDTAKAKYRELRDDSVREKAAQQHEIHRLTQQRHSDIIGIGELLRQRELALDERDEALRTAQLYKDSAELAQFLRGTVPARPAMDAQLKSLLTIAHPDRWAQGQPASVLAHDLTIAINGMREKREVQP